MTKREQLIIEYIPFATMIAKQMYVSIGKKVECDDLISCARIGLIWKSISQKNVQNCDMDFYIAKKWSKLRYGFL